MGYSRAVDTAEILQSQTWHSSQENLLIIFKHGFPREMGSVQLSSFLRNYIGFGVVILRLKLW